jgi:hypothetical protein
MGFLISDPAKWKDAWFSKLTPHEKLLFFYLIENCDSAGFIEVDYRMISFMTGMLESEITGAFKGLLRGYLGAKNTGWIWIKNFIKHQRNLPLNTENNAHLPIISRLKERCEIFGNPPEMQALIKGMVSVKKGESRGYLGATKPPSKVKYSNVKSGKGFTVVESFEKFEFNGYEAVKEPALKLAAILDDKFKKVMAMEKPLQPDEICKILTNHDHAKVMSVLRSMENNADLHKKYTSAYLTCVNWLERRTEGV